MKVGMFPRVVEVQSVTWSWSVPLSVPGTPESHNPYSRYFKASPKLEPYPTCYRNRHICVPASHPWENLDIHR
jgi:hypothetical protein